MKNPLPSSRLQTGFQGFGKGMLLGAALLSGTTWLRSEEASNTTTPAPEAPAPAAEAPKPAEEDDVIVLNPFVVETSKDTGYRAAQTLAATRMATDLVDVGASVSVMTKEFLRDVNATSNETALAYALNTEVGGPRGNYSGGASINFQGSTDYLKFSNPNANTRVRGLNDADNTRNLFRSDVPWEGYNVSRVDLQRGANAILFGLGSAAGVVNTNTYAADLSGNRGELGFTYDQFGSRRWTLDYNRVILADELALRVDAVSNTQQFRQRPAYSDDARIYGAVLYRPKLLNRDGMTFEISGNYERGGIDSNRPRITTPVDNITPWWKPESEGGLNRRVFEPLLAGPYLDRNNAEFYLPSLEREGTGSIAGLTYDPMDGSWEFTRSFKRGARAPDGSIIGAEDSAMPGIYPWRDYYAGVRPMNVGPWAGRIDKPYAGIGGYPFTTLTDPTVFDFYNKLIDGPNKGESSDWDVYDVSLTQTFLNGDLGYNLAFFRQALDRGYWSALGWGNALTVDITTHDLQGNSNPNVGRAYTQAEMRQYSNNDTALDREAFRLQVFAKHDFAKKDKSFMRRLLGEHRLTFSVSEEDEQIDSRDRMGAALDPQTAAFFNQPAIAGVGQNYGTFKYYLGGDLRGTTSSSGINLPGMTSTIFNKGGPTPIRYFDNTWIATGVNPGDPWVSPDPNITAASDPNHVLLYQSSNPANYAGWKTYNGGIVTLTSDGLYNGMSAKDYLTNSGYLSSYNIRSAVGIWQGYFWDKAIVATVGYRKDKSAKAQKNAGLSYQGTTLSSGGVNLSPSVYSLDAVTPDELSTITRSWSLVGHVNRFFGKRDFLPVDLRLYFNKGENFQPAAGRIDAFGEPLPPPQGRTQEYSMLVSTKDDRWSLRLTRYETKMVNGSLSTNGIPGTVWGLQQALSEGAWRIRALRNANWAGYGDEAQTALMRDHIAPDWLKFEKDLLAQFPGFVNAWMGSNSIFGKDTNDTTPPSVQMPNITFTENNVSKGWELELTANPTSNWRLTLNASKTEAVRSEVPGAAFRAVAEFIDNAFYKTNAGLAPAWWNQNYEGIRGSISPYTFFGSGYRTEWFKVNALNGQKVPELRKYRANLVTSYDFTTGMMKGVGIGGSFRWEDRSIIAFAPTKVAGAPDSINLNAPVFAPSERAVDFWLSYRRKISEGLTWKVQLNVYNAFGKNSLVPISAMVDPLTVSANPTPSYVVPMRYAAYYIREGRSWSLSNSIEF